MTNYEYEYYSGSEFFLKMNTNTVWVQRFGRIQIRISFGVPLLYEYDYEYSDYSIIPNMNTKTIKQQQIPELRTLKIAYWVFFAFR